MHARSLARTHAPTHPHTHTYACTYIQARRAHARTHARTHTHTCVFIAETSTTQTVDDCLSVSQRADQERCHSVKNDRRTIHPGTFLLSAPREGFLRQGKHREKCHGIQADWHQMIGTRGVRARSTQHHKYSVGFCPAVERSGSRST